MMNGGRQQTGEASEQEQDLAIGEAEFRTIFELAAWRVQVDPATGRFLRVNRKQCDITGTPPRNCCG